MADKKISALTSASLPLAGTEVVPLVQSSTTKKVAVADLTAGRDVQANNVLVNLTSAPGAFNNTVAVNSGASPLAGLQLVNNAVGSAYNTGFQVFLNGTDGYLSSFSGPLYVQTGGYTIRAEYDLSGNYKVNNGNVIIGAAGKGITTGGATALGFGVNGSVSNVTIDSNGLLGVGINGPLNNNMVSALGTNRNCFVAKVSNDAYATFQGFNSAYSATFYVDGTGQIYSTSTSIASISDASQKENVAPISYGLATINSLNPVKFDFKKGCGSGEKGLLGFIAQEVQPVVPELVKTFGDEGLLSLKMTDLVPILVKAVQELAAEVEALKKA